MASKDPKGDFQNFMKYVRGMSDLAERAQIQIDGKRVIRLDECPAIEALLVKMSDLDDQVVVFAQHVFDIKRPDPGLAAKRKAAEEQAAANKRAAEAAAATPSASTSDPDASTGDSGAGESGDSADSGESGDSADSGE